jgi:type IV secretory pathway protease TraF
VLAPPGRYEVDGLSMAPGLLPGDVVESGWFPLLDRVRRPQRHERWIVTSPDGTPAIKRVVAQSGETVAIRDGDLAIGGETVLTPPSVLAELASPVSEATIVSTGAEVDDGQWHRAVSMRSVLDDAAFAPSERRILLPVRDMGMAAVIRLRESPPDNEPVRIRVRIGGFVVPWRIRASGCYAVVAGRLDGRLVGAAWPLPDAQIQPAHGRTCLPPLAPATWDVAEPWRGVSRSAVELDDADGPPPRFSLCIMAAGMPVDRDQADAMIEYVTAWRDILHRPAADGVVEWRLSADTFFVLGDFPSGSRDSRHWGPLGRSVFGSRAAPVTPTGGGSIKRL